MVENSPGSGVSAPTAACWELRVLGGFRLTNGAGSEAPGFGKLDRALLTYLTLNQQQRHPRAKLAALLWPDRMTALRSLSVSLNILRQALGDKNGTLIGLRSDPVLCHFESIDVDALAFKNLIRQGTPEALEEAEALYGGDLLDGIDVRSDEFDRWLVAERMRLQGAAVDGLCRLMRHREQAGLSQKALDTARRILQMDELCEEAHRTIIRLHFKAGQRAAARTQAQHCEQFLRREGIEPEVETARIIAESRQFGTVDSHPSEPAPRSTEGNGAQQVPMPTPLPEEKPGAGTIQLPHRPAEGNLWRWVISAIALVLLIGVATLGRPVSRYWNVPWLAPNPVDNVILTIKAAIPGPVSPSIAVLRFGSPGGDSAAETLAHGLSGDITTALGKVSEIKEIKVIAAASMQAYGPTPPDLRTIAMDLKVRYLVLGSVRQSGDQLRVQVQLIDANEGRQVWGQSYPGRTSDVFVLQDQITFDVINEVYDVITASAMQRLTAHGTRNLGAWLEANEGLKLLRHLTPEDNARARLFYNRAIALDQDYAGAYEGLAWTHLLDAEFGWSPSIAESLAEAGRLTQRAIELNPEKPQLYSLRGHLNLLQRNFTQAVADGETAVEAERNDADASALLAFTLTYTGEPNRATALMNRAIELSPRHPAWYGWALGRAYRLAGDPVRAVEILEANLPERPASVIPLVELVIAYVEAEVPASAMAAMIRERIPHFSVGAWAALQPYEDPAMTERDAAALRAAGLPD